MKEMMYSDLKRIGKNTLRMKTMLYLNQRKIKKDKLKLLLREMSMITIESTSNDKKKTICEIYVNWP